MSFININNEVKRLRQSVDYLRATTPTVVTVYQLKIVLTDAQIKALPTTPIEVVPAPGANKAYFIIAANVVARLTSAYTNGELQANQVDVFLSTNNGGGNGTQSMAIPSDTAPSTIVKWATIATASYCVIAEVNNKNIAILSGNSFGNFTGGHASNTLEVTVFYSIVDL